MAYVEVVEEKIEDVIQVGAPARAADGVKMSTLVKEVQDKVMRLLKAEIELAKVELAAKAKEYAVAIALFAVAAFLLLFMFTLLIGAAVAGFATAFPVWGAFLLVALILLILAGILAFLGKKFLDKGNADKFDAPNNVKTDINRIKFALKRHRVKVEIKEDFIVPLAEETVPLVVSRVVPPQPIAARFAGDPGVEPVAVSVAPPTAVAVPQTETVAVERPIAVVHEEEVAVVAEPAIIAEVDDTAIIDQIVVSDDDDERSI